MVKNTKMLLLLAKNNQCYRATKILCIISFENVSITNVRNAMGATSEAGTVFPSGAHGFIAGFW